MRWSPSTGGNGQSGRTVVVTSDDLLDLLTKRAS